jgi:hypothetical protein
MAMHHVSVGTSHQTSSEESGRKDELHVSQKHLSRSSVQVCGASAALSRERHGQQGGCMAPSEVGRVKKKEKDRERMGGGGGRKAPATAVSVARREGERVCVCVSGAERGDS